MGSCELLQLVLVEPLDHQLVVLPGKYGSRLATGARFPLQAAVSLRYYIYCLEVLAYRCARQWRALSARANQRPDRWVRRMSPIGRPHRRQLQLGSRPRALLLVLVWRPSHALIAPGPRTLPRPPAPLSLPPGSPLSPCVPPPAQLPDPLKGLCQWPRGGTQEVPESQTGPNEWLLGIGASHQAGI